MKLSTHEERADYWAVRLEGGSLDAAERQALEQWLDSDPDNRARLSASCQFLTDLERQLPQLVPTGSTAAAVAVPARSGGELRARRRRRWAGLGAGALAAALACAALWWWRPSANPPPAMAPAALTLAPAATRVQRIALADGTRAELNVGTELKIDYRDEHQRTVRMDRGEAVFSVAKNPARPFVVETPGGRVRVTGTTFNVRLDAAHQLEVTVLEGAVEVTPAPAVAPVTSAPLRLEPGDQVLIEDQRVAVKRFAPGAALDVVAWRENRVVFDGVPLGEAMRRFPAYGTRRFVVPSDIAALRVGGRYNLDDLDGFLLGVASALALHVATDAEGVTHLTRP